MKNVVTAGIVSGLGTVTVPYNNRSAQYIRSDVVLAPGNSGGPLLDATGAVVGINAMIFGGDLAVAIPSHVASEWVAGIPSRRVYLGVGVQPVEVPADFRKEEYAERKAGLLVVATEQGGLAATSGVMIGDLLLDVAGKAVDNADTLREAINRGQNSGAFNLSLIRGGSKVTVEISLGETQQSV
jgi:serine protease Do